RAGNREPRAAGGTRRVDRPRSYPSCARALLDEHRRRRRWRRPSDGHAARRSGSATGAVHLRMVNPEPADPAADAVLSRRWAQLAWLSLAMLLGMTLWFSATAATAPIAAEFHLTPADTAWLTMAVQGGFVAGTLAAAILNLPDVVNARRLMAV